jgi:hypothetical protein
MAVSRANRAKHPIENVEEFGPFRNKNGPTDDKTGKDTRRYRGGIVGPSCAIQAAVINTRDWEEVVSSGGVVSYVSRIAKRALQDEGTPPTSIN